MKAWLIVLFLALVLVVGLMLSLVHDCPVLPAKQAKTAQILNGIVTGLELQAAVSGVIPTAVEELQSRRFGYAQVAEDLQSLAAVPADQPGYRDAWGQPIVIEAIAPGRFELRSFGLDGLRGTKDDSIRTWPAAMPGPQPAPAQPGSTPTP